MKDETCIDESPDRISKALRRNHKVMNPGSTMKTMNNSAKMRGVSTLIPIIKKEHPEYTLEESQKISNAIVM